MEHEWHCRLIGIVVDDLINHVRHFPLQAFYEDDQYNTVVCNLVFLRGLCPSLSSVLNPSRPSATGGSLNFNSISGPVPVPGHSDGACTGSALKLVAKTLLALVNVNVATKIHPDSLLTPDQFTDYRKRLLEEFCMALTSPLQPSEITQLDQLYETESFRASCQSLSRELATLANHFLEELEHNHSHHQHPSVGPCSLSTESGGTSQTSGHEFRPWECSSPPTCPQIYATLRELEDRTRQLIHGPRSVCALHN
ncbi:unnamed protein product [Echinostoma caproni]|uniref:Ras-GAP domain-containing protein n=1 Tax=Echinostoma caproni TaxID=27848 RepID=A0A3P8GER4_9TREM|nr:unnamed protein product [Echinostoma caproni]